MTKTFLQDDETIDSTWLEQCLKYHLTKVHGRTRKSVCNICTKSFQTNHDLSKHIQTCHEKKESIKFKCESCSKEFTQKRSLIQHQIFCQTKPENDECMALRATSSHIMTNVLHFWPLHTKNDKCTTCLATPSQNMINVCHCWPLQARN